MNKGVVNTHNTHIDINKGVVNTHNTHIDMNKGVINNHNTHIDMNKGVVKPLVYIYSRYKSCVGNTVSINVL